MTILVPTLPIYDRSSSYAHTSIERVSSGSLPLLLPEQQVDDDASVSSTISIGHHNDSYQRKSSSSFPALIVKKTVRFDESSNVVYEDRRDCDNDIQSCHEDFVGEQWYQRKDYRHMKESLRRDMKELYQVEVDHNQREDIEIDQIPSFLSLINSLVESCSDSDDDELQRGQENQDHIVMLSVWLRQFPDFHGLEKSASRVLGRERSERRSLMIDCILEEQDDLDDTRMRAHHLAQIAAPISQPSQLLAHRLACAVAASELDDDQTSLA